MSEFRAIPPSLVLVVPSPPGAHRKDQARKPRRLLTAAFAAVALSGAGAHALATGSGQTGAGRLELAVSQPDGMTAAHADTHPENLKAPGQEAVEHLAAPKNAAVRHADGRDGRDGPEDRGRPGRTVSAEAGVTGVPARAAARPPARPQQPAPPPPPPSATPPQQEGGAPLPPPEQPPFEAVPPAGAPAPAPPAEPAPPVDHLTLAYGDVHPAVRDLHANLRSLDLLAIEPSEEYCDLTAYAVRTFQEREGVAGDPPGVYGPRTHAALMTKVGRPLPPAPAPERPTPAPAPASAL